MDWFIQANNNCCYLSWDAHRRPISVTSHSTVSHPLVHKRTNDVYFVLFWRNLMEFHSNSIGKFDCKTWRWNLVNDIVRKWITLCTNGRLLNDLWLRSNFCVWTSYLFMRRVLYMIIRQFIDWVTRWGRNRLDVSICKMKYSILARATL